MWATGLHRCSRTPSPAHGMWQRSSGRGPLGRWGKQQAPVGIWDRGLAGCAWQHETARPYRHAPHAIVPPFPPRSLDSISPTHVWRTCPLSTSNLRWLCPTHRARPSMEPMMISNIPINSTCVVPIHPSQPPASPNSHRHIISRPPVPLSRIRQKVSAPFWGHSCRMNCATAPAQPF